jgi:hypothetical protein
VERVEVEEGRSEIRAELEDRAELLADFVDPPQLDERSDEHDPGIQVAVANLDRFRGKFDSAVLITGDEVADREA